MNYSPPDFTFEDFQNVTSKALSELGFITYVEHDIEDSVPWIYVTGTKVIKPKDALKILECVQSSIPEEVLFNSLRGKEMRIVVNGKFHFTQDELGMGFDETYAHDFGQTIESMKKEYELE